MLPYKVRLGLKVMFQKAFGHRTELVDDKKFNEILFWIMFGRKANFESPSTFSEYVCARKLRDDAYEFSPYTDKYEARKYVEATVGAEYLNECYGVYNSFDEIDFDSIPDRFALRGTHGSGYNIIVTDKNSFDKIDAAKKFKKWLSKNYYYKCRERNYKNIMPRISCDKYLECQKYDGLPELKVFCFGGKAKFICYNLCKDGKTLTNMYDSNWNYLDIQKGYGHFDDKTVPSNAEEIIRIAEKLADPFEFVRVDLYNVDDKIIFSELTFFTGGGFVPFNPPKYDEEFAKFFKELED